MSEGLIMAELHEQESEFSRLLRELPFDDAPRTEHAGVLRQQVLERFRPSETAVAAAPWWKHALTQGRDIMRRPTSRLVAGLAACAVIAFWLFVPGGPSSAHTFKRFARAFVEASTAHFEMELAVEGQPKQKFQAWYHAPNKFRQEIGPIINVSDFSAGKIVSLAPAQKTATIMTFTGVPKEKSSENYFKRLSELLAEHKNPKDTQVERLGEKEIDGKQSVGFQLDAPAATVTLWGDPKTGLPVRIESTWSGIPRTEVVMSHFEFNVPLKDALFDLTPPAGYKTQSFEVDASPSREQDLVQGFEAASKMGNGEFPETLDTAGVMKLVINYSISQAKDASGKKVQQLSDEKMQQLMKQSMKIGRGFQFALGLPESADARYAGKGVRKGDKDKPIFWYKPQGSTDYRVLYADLRFRDSSTAPQVAGAVRIEKMGKKKSN
jgi:outer membrane lipoprotein-sorting protein